MSKPYISVVFFYPVLHHSPCFPYIYFAAFTWNFEIHLKTMNKKQEKNDQQNFIQGSDKFAVRSIGFHFLAVSLIRIALENRRIVNSTAHFVALRR